MALEAEQTRDCQTAVELLTSPFALHNYNLQVFKAELAGSGAVAVKVLRKQSVNEARLWLEAEIMHSCRHPSILQVSQQTRHQNTECA